MNFVSKITFSALIILISGCVKTNVKDYSVENVKGNQVRTLAIDVVASDIGLQQEAERLLIEKFTAKGVKTFLVDDFLPPLRQYTHTEIRQAFNHKEIDTLLIVSIGESVSSSQVAFFSTNTNTYASATAYGNSVQGSADTTSTTTPVRSFKRATNSVAQLVSVSSGDTLWKAESETLGQGLLYTTDGSTASSLINEYVAKLESRGFIN